MTKKYLTVLKRKTGVWSVLVTRETPPSFTPVLYLGCMMKADIQGAFCEFLVLRSLCKASHVHSIRVEEVRHGQRMWPERTPAHKNGKIKDHKSQGVNRLILYQAFRTTWSKQTHFWSVKHVLLCVCTERQRQVVILQCLCIILLNVCETIRFCIRTWCQYSVMQTYTWMHTTV